MRIPDITGSGLSQKYVEQIAKSDPKEIKSFDNMEEALKYANDQHSGDEAIVKAKDGDKDVYVVVAIKSGEKSTSVFNPDEVSFRSAIITRNNNRIELVSPTDNISDDISTANSLSGVVQNDKVAGFSKSKAANNYANQNPAFQANLLTVLDKIDKTQEKVEKKKVSLSGELEALKSATPPDSEAISSKEKEISDIDLKLDEMKTAKGIMRSKLLIMSQTKGAGADGQGVPIPGTTLHVGDLRNKTSKASEGINARIAELQTKLITEKNPDKITSLKTQISALNKQSNDITNMSLQIRQADLMIRMRVGSLATINNDINTAQTSLSAKVKEVATLQSQLDANPRQEVRAGIEAKMNTLKAEIDKTRTDLISAMNGQIAIFKKNSSGQGGAKAAVELLNVQVKKLESIKDKSPQEIDLAVKQVQAEFKENLLIGRVSEAAQYWDGISPQEGAMLRNVTTNTGKYIADFKVAQKDLVKLDSDIQSAKKLPDFRYSDVGFTDLTSAQNWKAGEAGMTGVDANRKINETYSALDQEFSKYILGGTNAVDATGIKNPVSNWMTYGKFASREAGSQIQNLEGAMEALETLKKFDGSSQNDKRAAQALIRIMDTGPMTQQAIRMAATSMGVQGADKMGSVELVGEITAKLASDVGQSINLIDGVIKDLDTLHGALVKGNTEIYSNIVPAYEVFLKAESNGQNGVEALKKAGFNGPTGQTFIDDKKGIKDPQGFIVKAFTEYRNARNFEDKARIAETQGKPEEAAKLRQQRDQSMHKANLLIGCQEQMAILQKPEVFGHPKVAGMLKAMTGTMSIKDLPTASGDFRDNKLLAPNTATKDENWADFSTRMGLTDVTDTKPLPKDAMKVTGADNKARYYILPNNNEGIPKGPQGTISQYFADNLTNPDMIKTPPRDIQPLYRDRVEGEVDLAERVLDLAPIQTVVIPLVADGAVRVASNTYRALFD